jgi:hypothetical protein
MKKAGFPFFACLIAAGTPSTGPGLCDRSDNSPAADLSRTASSPGKQQIPVATGNGIVLMSPDEYWEYVKPMGHLPILSKSYVFGRTIPMPRTDKFGHIVSQPQPSRKLTDH